MFHHKWWVLLYKAHFLEFDKISTDQVYGWSLFPYQHPIRWEDGKIVRERRLPLLGFKEENMSNKNGKKDIKRYSRKIALMWF